MWPTRRLLCAAVGAREASAAAPPKKLFFPQLHFKASSRLACGLVGLPNVGKSTLFNALTEGDVPAENYPFCTIDPHLGMTPVPDERLEPLSRTSGSQKIVPAAVEFIDIAGLVAGAADGKGLGNKFLQNIRDADAYIHVVRCFDASGVHRADGEQTLVSPANDAAVVDTELLLADLQAVERAMSKGGNKKDAVTKTALAKVARGLEAGQPARLMQDVSIEEWEALRPYPLLTAMPVLYVANVGLGDSYRVEHNEHAAELQEYALSQGASTVSTTSEEAVVALCAHLEQDLQDMESAEERQEFLVDLELVEAGQGEGSCALGPGEGLEAVITAAYRLLGFCTFLTTGEVETRAWRLREGSNAAEAASVIHSDIGENLVRAEVCAYTDLMASGDWDGARAKGLVRAEGKQYIVQDGDVCHFLHSD